MPEGQQCRRPGQACLVQERVAAREIAAGYMVGGKSPVRVDAAWSRGPARLQHPLVGEPPVPVPLRSVIADHCDHTVRMFIAYVQSLY